MNACPLVVLACESLHVCTVCIWRCEHARFCVEGFYALYINLHSFKYVLTETKLQSLLNKVFEFEFPPLSLSYTKLCQEKSHPLLGLNFP